ncbi:hypothetical protein [Nocardiopsis sp. MG754419]|uniref:hypothetical protein n=1 Tax=Nocardiopsis sp. MG754419 TaxID=2259865 RepID=UPI001BA949BA|nr:hypothetical protein [Nocardiopsis sp. MG754419]MBR8743818.1 hypothetical protein [Nocardiopsis sp. MG754419]
MADATTTERPIPEGASPSLVEMITESLWGATTLRERYPAVFELQAEARRRPALAAVPARVEDTAFSDSSLRHRQPGTSASPETIDSLITLYQATLFTLVNRPQRELDRARVHRLVEAMARGAFDVGPPLRS